MVKKYEEEKQDCIKSESLHLHLHILGNQLHNPMVLHGIQGTHLICPLPHLPNRLQQIQGI
jgi:hypothetical protein